MKLNNIVIDKSYAFALRIVKLYKYLQTNDRNGIISKQVLRSGTSIGANIRESVYGQSTLDFISKLSISLKEASETEYWIMLLRDSGYIEDKDAESLLIDCRELEKLLTSIIIKTKKNNNIL